MHINKHNLTALLVLVYEVPSEEHFTGVMRKVNHAMHYVRNKVCT